MFECFVPKNFSAEHAEIIDRTNAILEEYERDGLVLTLRQIYYQFVTKNWLANTEQSYKRLGSIINDARLAGLIDWARMEDRLRAPVSEAHWRNAEEIVTAVADQYRQDVWANQPYRVEVWVEKDALSGVIDKPCKEHRVDYLTCRGYVSQSALYEAGRRFAKYIKAGQKPLVLHLGDHDPSGIDMTRDNTERLQMFARGKVRVKRIALNMEQVEQYNPPPNPAKMSDGRASGYVERFGVSSWEVDALNPRTIVALINAEIEKVKRVENWEWALGEEEENRKALTYAAENWDATREWLTDRFGDEDSE